MLIIRKSNKRDKSNIEILRESSYKQSSFLKPINKSYNKWSLEDDRSIIFIAENANGILATARTKVINNSIELKKRNRILNTSIKYPILLVDQTATKTDFQGLGLNTLIRFKIINYAKTLNINAIVGLVSKDSPRYNSMLKYKYTSRLALLTDNFFNYIISNTQLMLLILNRNNFDDAINEIKNSKAYKFTKLN